MIKGISRVSRSFRDRLAARLSRKIYNLEVRVLEDGTLTFEEFIFCPEKLEIWDKREVMKITSCERDRLLRYFRSHLSRFIRQGPPLGAPVPADTAALLEKEIGIKSQFSSENEWCREVICILLLYTKYDYINFIIPTVRCWYDEESPELNDWLKKISQEIKSNRWTFQRLQNELQTGASA